MPRWNNNRVPPVPLSYKEQFVRKVGPKILALLLGAFAKLLIDPILHSSKSGWQNVRKNVLEPKLTSIYDTIGIPKDPQVRIGLDQYVFEHLPTPKEHKSLFRVERFSE